MREIEVLDKCALSNENKQLIKRFQNYLFSKGSSGFRVYKVSAQLRKLFLELNKEIPDAVKDDILTLVSSVNRNIKHREATRADFCRALKQFYIWYEDEDERLYSKDDTILRRTRQLYKYVKSDMKTSYKDPFRDPNEIITEEDINQVLQKGCKTTRDRALLKVLHSTGIRVGELLNMRIGHIKVNVSYGEIAVFGKTGQRTVYLTDALPSLTQYLEVHPLKNDTQAFLWIGESNRYGLEPLARDGCQEAIDRCFERAQIKKRHNCHWFRHSRATIWAKKYTESVLCRLMGWSAGSKQVRRYVHLAQEDIRTEYLKQQGIIKEDAKQDNKPQICVCGQVNDSTARYCYKCGKVLNVAVAIEDNDKKSAMINEAFELFQKIMADPVKLKKYTELLKAQQEAGK